MEAPRALLSKQRITDALELAHAAGALRDRHVDAIIRTLNTPETIVLKLTIWHDGDAMERFGPVASPDDANTA
jgi:hypothetical protein